VEIHWQVNQNTDLHHQIHPVSVKNCPVVIKERAFSRKFIWLSTKLETTLAELCDLAAVAVTLYWVRISTKTIS
jgi:hypothetical protein